MSDINEVQLEELTGSDLEYWAGMDCFEITDSKFLLNNWKPKAYDRRKQALPRRVTDTERRLRDWLRKNGHGNLLSERKTVNQEYSDFVTNEYKTRPVNHVTPDKPVPKDIIKQAAEAMGLKPIFLFPDSLTEGTVKLGNEADINPDSEGIMFYRLLAAMAIDYGYDPSKDKQGNGIMRNFQKMLQMQGWPDKQERIKEALEIAIQKSSWKPQKS